MRLDTESKTIPANAFRLENLINQRWDPQVSLWTKEEQIEEQKEYKPTRRQERARDELLQLLEHGSSTTQAIAEARGVTRSTIHKQLVRHLDAGRVTREQLPDGSNRWSLASE